MKAQQSLLKLLFQVSDSFWVTISWWLAVWIRFYSSWSFLPLTSPETKQTHLYVIFNCALILSWLVGFHLVGAYQFSRTKKILQELMLSLKGSFFSFLFIIAITFFIARQDFSRITLLIYLILVTLLVAGGRVLMHSMVRKLRRKGWNQASVLVIGDQKLSKKIEDRIQAHLELGLKIQDFYPVDSSMNSDQLCIEVENKIKSQKIDQVFLAFKNENAKLMDGLINTLIELPVEIKIMPDVIQYSLLGFEVEEFEGLPIVSLNQSPIVGWSAILKRILDIVASFIAIIIFSPVMVLLTILVKISSRGPVFYKQERMGIDGTTFQMLKFRSMPLDAENKTGAVWAKKEDNRATPVGEFMRKTSLDELPQFFNVLVGDMSVVGPRPERPVFVEKFRKEIPGYMLRHKVKAGITGWAQVCGYRGNTSLEGRIEHDLYYINNWSLIFDIKILFLTIFKGFVSPNAY